MKNIFLDFKWFYFFGIIFYGFSVYLLYKFDEFRAFPTFSLACAAVFFSYLAYKYSREKFRLELMDKRLEIYENVLKFCSTSMKYASLSKIENEDAETSQEKIEGIQAAHEAFRGIGYHKYKMLFGKDIEDIFEKMNKSFAVLVSKGYPPTHAEYSNWLKRENEALDFISEAITELPEYFKPYLYFGDYKK